MITKIIKIAICLVAITLAVVYFTASDEPPLEKVKGRGFIVTTQAWVADGTLKVSVKNLYPGWHEYNIELIKDGKVIAESGTIATSSMDESGPSFDNLAQGKYVVKVWENGSHHAIKTKKIEF